MSLKCCLDNIWECLLHDITIFNHLHLKTKDARLTLVFRILNDDFYCDLHAKFKAILYAFWINLTFGPYLSLN